MKILISGKKRKIYIGPKGGTYYMKKGIKIYFKMKERKSNIKKKSLNMKGGNYYHQDEHFKFINTTLKLLEYAHLSNYTGDNSIKLENKFSLDKINHVNDEKLIAWGIEKQFHRKRFLRWAKELKPIITLNFIEENVPKEVLDILKQSPFWNNYIIPLFVAKKRHQNKEMRKQFRNENGDIRYQLSIFLEPLFIQDVTPQECYTWWLELATKGCLPESGESIQRRENESSNWIPVIEWYVIPTLSRFEEILEDPNCFRNLELHLLIVLVNQVIKILDNYIKYKGNKRQFKNTSMVHFYGNQNEYQLSNSYSKKNKGNKNTSMVNFYKKNEYQLSNSYSKKNRENVAYQEFKDFLDEITILCDSRKYKDFKKCALSHDKWYMKRVYKGFELDPNSKRLNGKQLYNQVYKEYINTSYSLPILIMPMVYNHGYKSYLKQYVCGIVLYYSTTFSAHEGLISHPVAHIWHNIGFHSQNLLKYYQSINNFKYFNYVMLYNLNILSKIYQSINSNDLSFLLFQIYHETLIDRFIETMNNYGDKLRDVMNKPKNYKIIQLLKNLKLDIDLNFWRTHSSRFDINPILIFYALNEFVTLLARREINFLVFKLYKRTGEYYDLFIELRDIFKNNILEQGVALEHIENIGNQPEQNVNMVIQSIFFNPKTTNSNISYTRNSRNN